MAKGNFFVLSNNKCAALHFENGKKRLDFNVVVLVVCLEQQHPSIVIIILLLQSC